MAFSAVPRAHFYIGGDAYSVQTTGQSYSLSNPDPQTLRFEIRPGDHAWFDGSNVDRAEIADPYIPIGTPAAIDYQFMVQPNGPNSAFTNMALWFATAEMHNNDEALGAQYAYLASIRHRAYWWSSGS